MAFRLKTQRVAPTAALLLGSSDTDSRRCSSIYGTDHFAWQVQP